MTIPTPLNCERQIHHLYVVRLLKEQYGIGRDVLFEKLASKAAGLIVHHVPLPHSRTTGGKHNIGGIPCGGTCVRSSTVTPPFHHDESEPS